MTAYAIGIDCGSSFCKAVRLGERGIEAQAVLPTGWNIGECGGDVVRELMKGTGLPPAMAIPLTATGYGREKIKGSRGVLTEISAHARGAEFLARGVRTLIDIGGQDSKIIAVEDGRVKDFQMNDKCAAGSGRFLEIISRRLDIDPLLIDEFLKPEKSVSLNSTCAVFVESEIIGLLAGDVSREEILGGVAASMAIRIAALAGRMALIPPAVLTGGLSESAGICRALSRALGLAVVPLPQGTFAGAIGAACIGLEADKNP
jgi:predicted CoA-substrate-specific enzyme activase